MTQGEYILTCYGRPLPRTNSPRSGPLGRLVGVIHGDPGRRPLRVKPILS
uniref:Uncharacterized protein n=1 Tax=uncultured Acidobacteria bacterium HF4000_26D02 TaxID=710731 RepID=E0XW59_9BACT|nr:hypothetical protein [uncultured Acidobacteria bacterium HF4000_26D02]